MRNSRTLLTAGMILAAAGIHAAAGKAGATDILDILFGKGRVSRPSARRVLQNGQTVAALAGLPGTRQHFQIDIPPGTGRLAVGTIGGSGDCDLYLSRGALPEPKSYQYVSNGSSTDEAITIHQPAPGTWHILVYGYSRFDGAGLTATWSVAQPHRPEPPRPHRWIRITGPAAGGVLTAGDSYWVQWATSGHSRRIRVLQSFDEGRTWTDIAPRSTALAGAGRLLWTVPFVQGRAGPAAARIRIVDADNPSIQAISAPWAVARRRGGQPGHPGRPDPPGSGPRSGTDPYEPNDRSSAASRIEANSIQHHTIRDRGDEDWLVFVPPTAEPYRITFTDVTVELKVRLYTAKAGSSRESKYRTFTVKKGRSYSLDYDVSSAVKYLKLHVQADDGSDTGGYRVSVQRVARGRPAKRPPVPTRGRRT
jgi:hypothetical protein